MNAYRLDAERNFRVFSITSGKGGVGKTLMTVNLAFALKRKGYKILIIDGNFGNGNVEVMLKALPEVSIKDVLAGTSPIKDALLEISDGISLIPAGTGAYEISEPDAGQKLSLLSELDTIDQVADVVIVDTPPGISPNVMFFNSSVSEIILITTPEITSLVNTLSSINVLHNYFEEKEFKLVVNMAESEDEAISTYDIIHDQIAHLYDIHLHYCGFIPYRDDIKDSIRFLTSPISVTEGKGKGKVFIKVAEEIMKIVPDEVAKKGQQFFAKRVLREEHDRTLSHTEEV